MAWTTPRTWVSGELVAASEMNADVRDNLSALAAIIGNTTGVNRIFIPAVDFTLGTGATLAGVGTAAADLDMPAWAFDAASDEYVITSVYVPWALASCTVTASIYWAPSSTNTGLVRWEVRTSDIANGEQIDQAADETDVHSQAGSGTADALHITTPVALSRTGQFWRITVYRDADGSGGTDSFTGDAWFVGLLLEATAT